MDDAVKEQNKNLNTYISGPVYFRMWMHIFDFKSKQKRSSALIDLAIYYAILIALMFLVRWITSFLVGYIICIIWLTFYLVSKIIPLSTYARRLRSAGFSWRYCFFIFIPLFRIYPIIITFMPNKDDSKEIIVKDDKIIFPDKEKLEEVTITGVKFVKPDIKKSQFEVITAIIFVFWFFTALFRAFMIDNILGDVLMKYSINVNDYEQFRNDVRYADEHLPESIEGFGNPKEIKFGYKKVSESRVMGFGYDSLSLFASYGNNYLDEKERLLNTYEFATYDDVKELIGFDSFSYNNYTFYIGKNDSSYYYAKELFMIGFDDSNGYISYLYYYDFDRDLVTYSDRSEEERLKQLYKFIDNHFVWLSF